MLKAASAILTFWCTLGLFRAASADTLDADLILLNGSVHTERDTAQAVAIRNGLIVAVGSNGSVDRFHGAHTRVIDLHGAAVLPGLHDMHVHPVTAGLRALKQCQVGYGATREQTIRSIADCVSRRKPGDWIQGGPYDSSAFDRPPDRQMLDVISPNNPVSLTDVSGHAAWLNSKALAALGIDRATPQPKGGVIERYENGDATGILRESALVVLQRIPPPTRRDYAEALAWALQQLLSYGVTSLTDAAATKEYLQAYDDLADAGQLMQRVRACILFLPPSAAQNSSRLDPIRDGPLYARARMTTNCVKFILDGVPDAGRTAAFIDPYLPAPGRPRDEHGQLFFRDDILFKAVQRFDAAHLTAKFHASGDASARQALDAIESARKANGPNGPRHEVAHSGFVQPSDIYRAKRIGATLEFSPAIWYPSPLSHVVAAMLGPDRMSRLMPVREALDAGVTAVGGTDWPTSPSPNPWPAIETLVTRMAPGGANPETLAPRERISLQEAFALYTSSAAAQLGLRGKEGVIAPGMWADLAVTDRNPFAIPITDVHAIKVKMTLIAGEIVYRDRTAAGTR